MTPASTTLAFLAILDGQSSDVVDLQRAMTAIPALGPESGGQGEIDKIALLREFFSAAGLTDIREYRSPDDRVACGYRPNLVAVLPGKDTSRTLWVISHADVVPPGDLSMWTSDPWTVVVDGDFVVGRGVEDDQMAIVSSFLAARAFIESGHDFGISPAMNLGLMVVADEETGSKHGLGYLMDKHPELFGADDLYLIPDTGVFDSSQIEVAEKSILWLKVTVHGKQCHASKPQQGVNSLVAAAEMILAVEGLHQRFPATDELFSPPASTFQSTKKEANVESVNILPGKDVFYVDCRVLPEYDLDEVFDAIREIGRGIEERRGVRIEYDFAQRAQAAPGTDPKAEIVTRLATAIKAEYGVDAKPVGVGGGTVAAYLRRKGLPAAVWSTWLPNAHQPNERASISKTIGDAKVIARMLLDGDG